MTDFPTAEAFVRDRGGTIEYRREATVARFHEPDKYEEFIAWLTVRSYIVLSVDGALTVAFKAPLATVGT